MVATRKNPDIQALYERLLAADKTKMCAIGGIAIAIGVGPDDPIVLADKIDHQIRY